MPEWRHLSIDMAKSIKSNTEKHRKQTVGLSISLKISIYTYKIVNESIQ